MPRPITGRGFLRDKQSHVPGGAAVLARAAASGDMTRMDGQNVDERKEENYVRKSQDRFKFCGA